MLSQQFKRFAFVATASVFAFAACQTSGDDDTDSKAGTGGAAPVQALGTGGSGSGGIGSGSGGGAAPMHAGTGGGTGAAMPATGSGGQGAAGSSAPASGTPMADAGLSDAGMTPAMHEDLGEGTGQDVVTIGDSWMSLITVGIEQSLAKASGRTYRNYSVPGTLVLNEQIPGQYEDAKMQNPDIKTVVMTGGGNDILQSTCADEACNPVVDDVADRLNKLMDEMKADGVLDIMLIGYTYPDLAEKRESLDYSRMLDATLCTTGRIPRCHFLDSTMLDLTLRDGIHPDDAGYDLIGQTVWKMMQDDGVRR